MSHEITIRADGKAEMAFRKGTQFPWHFDMTNPVQVPAEATIEEWVHAAGMEWSVNQSPVKFDIEDETHTYKERTVLYRSDNKFPLGVVSDNYCILQPRECLEFFEELVHTVGLELDTAGTLFGGKRFWALAKIGESAMIDNRDPMKGYLLLTSSADGTLATQARFTSVRVVCQNTLSLSDRKDGKDGLKITHRSQWDPEVVKQRLGVAPATFEAFMSSIRKLADVRLTDDQAQKHVRKLLGKTEDDKGTKTFESIMGLFRGLAKGHDQPGFKDTAWGLLNSATEHFDHHTRKKSDSHRLYDAMIGGAATVKSNFRNQLLELVN